MRTLQEIITVLDEVDLDLGEYAAQTGSQRLRDARDRAFQARDLIAQCLQSLTRPRRAPNPVV
jgi:hypothetical protein